MLKFVGIPGITLALGIASALLGAPQVQAASTLYDMNQMLGQGNPLDTAPAARPAPVPAIQPATSPAFGSQLYDMDRMLNERNPFDTSPVSQPPVGQRAPAANETAQLPPGPKPAGAKPAASGGAKKDADPNFPDLENYDLDDMGADVDGNDPLEPLNRGIFAVNEFLYKWLLTPLARGYNAVVPDPIRSSLSNAISNLNGPVILANDLLQGEFTRAGDTTARFVINSTLGFLGTQDVASDLGFDKHSEDFGQTMGAWGLGEGFYLVLPLLGPSNPRDAIGKYLVDGYFDPLGYYLEDTDNEDWGYVRSGVSGFDDYAGIVDDLDNLRQTSVDFYGALRSLYRQRREAEIRNQEQGAVPAIGGR